MLGLIAAEIVTGQIVGRPRLKGQACQPLYADLRTRQVASCG
jgi:hypothetical protein